MPDNGIWLWLCALAAALVLLTMSPLCLLERKRGDGGSSSWMRQAWVCAVCLLAALCLWDSLRPVAIPWPSAIQFFTISVGALSVLQLALCAARSTWWKPTAGALLVTGLFVTGHAGWRFLQLSDGADEFPELQFWDSIDHRETVILDRAPALTDAGRPIPLYGCRTDAVLSIADQVNMQNYTGRVIRIGKASLDCNCHGYVYTGGKFWIKGSDVNTILQDNGYQAVQAPQPGDLVIYRDDAGNIVHTGTVKAIGEKGFVLVESKWGPLGVYLHAPDDQCYGRQYTFYRSSRTGHLLMRLADDAALSAAGN